MKPEPQSKFARRQYVKIWPVNSTKSLDQQCTHINHGGETCIFLIYNGFTNQEYLYKNHFRQFSMVAQDFKRNELNFGKIDGICHRELLEYFEISEVYLPTAVAYNPVKQMISNLKIFSEEGLKRYLQEVADRSKRSFPVTRRLEEVFQNKNCH